MVTLTTFIRTIPARVQFARHRRWLRKGRTVDLEVKVPHLGIWTERHGAHGYGTIDSIDYRNRRFGVQTGELTEHRTFGFDQVCVDWPDLRVVPPTRGVPSTQRDLLGRQHTPTRSSYSRYTPPEPLIYRLTGTPNGLPRTKTAALIQLSYILTGRPWVSTTELEVPWSKAIRRLAREARW